MKIVDPIECKTKNSVIKFFMDLFGDQATTSDALLFDSDRRLIVEIISRELSDRSINDEVNFFLFEMTKTNHRLNSLSGNNCVFIIISIDATQSIYHG